MALVDGTIALVAALSLYTSGVLVGAGYGLPVATVASVSNTTPVSVTTTAAHGLSLNSITNANPLVITLTGVVGATVNDTWWIFVTGPTTFLLIGPSAGGLASVATGAGTGGMVQAALRERRIMFGRNAALDFRSPPSIVMIPIHAKFSPKDVYSRAVFTQYNPEQQAQIQSRSLSTDSLTFEVHAWGQYGAYGTGVDPEFDIDIVEVLYNALIQQAYLIGRGSVTINDGVFVTQKAGLGQINKAGEEFVFGVTFDRPILDVLNPLSTGAKPNSTVQIQPADGSPPEVAVTGI